MNVTSGVSEQTRLLSPSESGCEEKQRAEIVEFNAYGNKPRCLMYLGTSAILTSVASGVCSGVVASVGSGAVYTTAFHVFTASFGLCGLGLLGLCAGLYLEGSAVRSRPAYP
ncbi:TPA: hypothetical protein M4K80_003606 [Salmonella enterica]|nr:hypothetical protein [Salmonella enterica]